MLFLEGEPFTTGSQPYLFRPAVTQDSSKRIIVEIEIQGCRTHAMLDTGAPFLVCEPDIAKILNLDPDACLEKTSLSIRGENVPGRLHRLDLTLMAEEGERLIIDATVFVPNSTVDSWPGLPSVLGFEGCLERVRFALDTSSETFYFGPHPERDY